MNGREALRLGRVLGGLLVWAVGLLVWLAPMGAAAQGTPFATVTLWEIQESLRFKKGDDAESIAFRLANATLVGDATGGLCAGAVLVGAVQDPCAIDARATSNVNLATGTGPINGSISIMVDSNPGSPMLSDLVLVATGEIHGEIDLRPAVLFQMTGGAAGAPIAPANGTWRSRQLNARGTFSGAFLIPIPFGGCPKGFAYFNPGVLFECLTDADFSLGAPATKITAVFERQSSRDRHGDDD